MVSWRVDIWKNKDKRNKLEGKKTKQGTPNSIATSKLSVPKRLATKATKQAYRLIQGVVVGAHHVINYELDLKPPANSSCF